MGQTALRKAGSFTTYTGTAPLYPAFRWWRAPAYAYRAVRRAAYAPNGIDTIVIHATAGASSAGAMSVIQEGTASWHALVPDENEPGHGEYIYRCVPDESAAWHVLSGVKHPADGKQNINDRALGIEIVNYQDGKDTFSDWQLRVTAAWVRWNWWQYGIRFIYTHAFLDPSRKSDPGGLFDWEKFMAYVMAGSAVPTAPHDPPLLISPSGAVVSEGRMIDGVMWTPTRKTVEAAGARVAWRGDQGKAYITAG